MRLLNTRSLQFKEFSDSKDVPRYAILSHVWDTHEQTFQEIAMIITDNTNNNVDGEGSWRNVSFKIADFCKLAASFGYDWGWVDTCCINKESSAELSEAINSMFAWYTDADICIAYLKDVRGENDMDRSVWFTRGWTLQELVAPGALLFVTAQWEPICTRASRPDIVTSATGIPINMLNSPGAFAQASVIDRFRWARPRKTTRLEDRAYSLMGLFGVNMPIIYGEGERAFRRLQEEILKTSPDQTLFTWGTAVLTDLRHDVGPFNWPPGLFAPRPGVVWWTESDFCQTPKPLPLWYAYFFLLSQPLIYRILALQPQMSL